MGSAEEEAEGTTGKLGSLALMGSAEEEAEGTARKLGSLALMGSAGDEADGTAKGRRASEGAGCHQGEAAISQVTTERKLCARELRNGVREAVEMAWDVNCNEG